MFFFIFRIGPNMNLNTSDPQFEYNPRTDPTKQKYACAYCGDKFYDMATRGAHERYSSIFLEPGKIMGRGTTGTVHIVEQIF